MERAEAEDPESGGAVPPGARLLLSFKEFLSSRKGRLLLAEAVLSFIIFICYIASSAGSFLIVPLLTLLAALCFFFAYSLKLNERFKAVYWLLAVSVWTHAINLSRVNEMVVGGRRVLGFIATVVYCVYVYLTFNDLMTYLKQGDSSDAPEPRKSEDDDSDSDSD
uniref:CKLF like MARVEL transmembrane domain containing 3 n=1 Tax=Podarcis muralis TaxID=64176 RepID=A0A670IRH4_PODMU